jgi:hypothetical protein
MKVNLKAALTVATMSFFIALPAHAQFGGLSLPGAGGGGGGFGDTAKEYSANIITGMVNSVRGIKFVQDALGKKAEAEQLEAIAKEIESKKEPSAEANEHAAKAIADNPVNRDALKGIKSVEGKKYMALATKHMIVAGVYNSKAAASASALASKTPGPMDALSAPSLLDAAKVTINSGPATIKNTGEYLSALTDYSSQNGIPRPSATECQELASKTDPNAAKNASQF